jgi:hypothetical protein
VTRKRRRTVRGMQDDKESDVAVAHFLLECPIYAHERWILAKRLREREKGLTLENILGDEEAIIPLANFIIASHRFVTESHLSSHN